MSLLTEINRAKTELLEAPTVPVKRWQGLPSQGHFREVVNFQLKGFIPRGEHDLQEMVAPNLPWAEDHFQERVGGAPLNPGDQYKNWPFWTGQRAAIVQDSRGQFSHTYMERIWPHQMGAGIRYDYGDLNDVVGMLWHDPYTRQAYLPIWFPEDTGAVHGKRVPCTLGYHFMMREGYLHCWYFIRSCDFVHYLRDDIYMAGRLCQWVLARLQEMEQGSFNEPLWADVDPGYLHMTICSLHVFTGDFHVLDA